MDLTSLRPGHKIRIRDGAKAEVLAGTQDGEWIRVRYLDDKDDPLFTETEDLAHKDEIEGLIGVTQGSAWGEAVAVVIHQIPESEESEEGYEAVTMKGVPRGVTVTGSDPESAEGALNHLLDGLRAFGFIGQVAVDDVTVPGPAEQYKVYVASDD